MAQQLRFQINTTILVGEVSPSLQPLCVFRYPLWGALPRNAPPGGSAPPDPPSNQKPTSPSRQRVNSMSAKAVE
jgi:hypothetical protein